MEIVVGGGGEKLYSQNLGDFLRIKEEDHWRNVNQSTPSSSGGAGRISSRLTLNAILSEKIGQSPPTDEPLRRVEPNRTLLDIIRDDQISRGRGRGRGDDRRSWLKDKIRLRRRGGRSAWPAAVATSSSVVNNNNNNHNLMMMAAATQNDSVRFNSAINSGESTQPDSRSPVPLRNPRRSTENSVERFELMFSPQSRRLITDDVPQNENEELRTDAVELEAVQAEVGVSPPQQPVRMSLMALLAENDRQNGLGSSAFMLDEALAEEDAENETGTSAGAAGSGPEVNNCCVCMVRHKGAAFIPCGHTFCRLCSRELWLQRGNCPLCNNFIREILDIF